MRTAFLAVALAAISSHALAGPRLPAPGLYCPVGVGVPPILVDAGGGLGIDLLDCEGVQLRRGRARSAACFANGGSTVPSTSTSPCAGMARSGTTASSSGSTPAPGRAPRRSPQAAVRPPSVRRAPPVRLPA